jgi:hypothetical protein
VGEPHRVVYTWSKKICSRVLPTKEAAEEFAKDYPGAKVQDLNAPVEKNPSGRWTRPPSYMKKNKCACGKTKVVHDEKCGKCRDLPLR